MQSKKTLYILLSVFILWIILYEFILPVNNVLPRPSIVLLSFGALWHIYKLPQNLFNSIAVIYFSMAASYFFILVLRNILLMKNHFIKDIILSIHWFFKFVPAIILGLFFIYWLPYSFFTEFIFILTTSFLLLAVRLNEESEKINPKYAEAARSLGIDENVIQKKVIWNLTKPETGKYLLNLNFYLWSVLIAFEYIKGGYGMGNIFRIALQYRDLSTLFLTAFITGVVIYLGNLIIRYINNKFFFWSAK